MEVKYQLFRFIVIISILVWTLSPFPGCMVDEKVATQTLEKSGYSNVQVLDRTNWFVFFKGGSGSDRVRFTCQATNPAGKEVSGIYIFAGWPFKGATVRFDNN